ncbi:hypothetical protein QBC45DRAFT_429779 [Copromyces sp. CBS 386.78]|nr:hypothetical protein QBC45DRAFT_429779 [Copromyces sp. CBS 386.78]
MYRSSSFRGLDTGISFSIGNISGGFSDNGLRRLDKDIGNPNSIGGGPSGSSSRRLGIGSGFGYGEASGGLGSRGFGYPSSPSSPNSPGSPGGPLSSLGGPSSPF